MIFAIFLAKQYTNRSSGFSLETNANAAPRLDSWINDDANVLSGSERRRLSELLENYQRETNHQIVVLIIATLRNESIERFSHRVFKNVGIGRKGLNDGILVTVAIKEKKARIELGTGMARFISNTDAEIIAGNFAPSFSRGDFAGGLERGLKELMKEGRRFTVRETLKQESMHSLACNNRSEKFRCTHTGTILAAFAMQQPLAVRRTDCGCPNEHGQIVRLKLAPLLHYSGHRDCDLSILLGSSFIASG